VHDRFVDRIANLSLQYRSELSGTRICFSHMALQASQLTAASDVDILDIPEIGKAGCHLERLGVHFWRTLLGSRAEFRD
jgi:hypothetical protein